jgi:competence protein ComEC
LAAYAYVPLQDKASELPDIRNTDYVILNLSAPLQEKENSWKGIFTADYIVRSGAAQSGKGAKILIYFDKDTILQKLQYGSRILVPASKIHPVSPTVNPEQFDYKRYLFYRHIFYTSYLKKGDYAIAAPASSNRLMSRIYDLKTILRQWLEQELPGKKERGIAEALLLGDTDEMQPDVSADYSSTGTIHILSVSGMHVGILFLTLQWLTGFLNRNTITRIVRVLLLLAGLWFYAVFTGFSPPVVRTTAMFSFVCIGSALARRSSIYNRLSLAALVLLLADPYTITQAGFQLSFAAIIGIVWIQPDIAAWYTPANKIEKWFWELMSASLAAQLATLPLSLYYFNQFPTWFLVSNLLIVPLSVGVMAAAALYLVLILGSKALPLLAEVSHFSGILLYYSIKSLNGLANYLAHWPGAVWSGFYLTLPECVALYAFLFFLLLAVFQKSRRFLLSATAVLLLFTLSLSYRTIKSSKEELTFFSVPKHLAIVLAGNQHLYALADSDCLADKKFQGQYLRRYAFSKGIDENNINLIPYNKDTFVQTQTFCYRYPYLSFDHKTYIIVDKMSVPVKATNLVLFKAHYKTAKVLEDLPQEAIVMVAGSGLKTTGHLKNESQRLGLRFIDLSSTIYQP